MLSTRINCIAKHQNDIFQYDVLVSSPDYSLPSYTYGYTIYDAEIFPDKIVKHYSREEYFGLGKAYIAYSGSGGGSIDEK